MSANDLFPSYEGLVSRSEKQHKLGQTACALWFTGLSGSGKSTLAGILDHRLYELGYTTVVLDGDNVRTGLNSNLGFSEADRQENLRRIAELNKILINNGLLVINCFVSPRHSDREMVKQIIGASDFAEIYVDASLEACEMRDVKGLYKKARAGLIPHFTGISAPFEIPSNPDCTIPTDRLSIAESMAWLENFVLRRIQKIH